MKICTIEECNSKLWAKDMCLSHYNRIIRREKLCSVKDCGMPKLAKNLCSSHYARLNKFGDIREDVPFQKKNQSCQFPGCVRKHNSKGWCSFHRQQIRRGEELSLEPKRAPNGTGHINNYGYRMIGKDKIYKFEHRIVLEQMLGRPLFKDENVHHINGVRDDNRPENLELWIIPQPPGQRVKDLVEWAHEIIKRYEGVDL